MRRGRKQRLLEAVRELGDVAASIQWARKGHGYARPGFWSLPSTLRRLAHGPEHRDTKMLAQFMQERPASSSHHS